MNCYMAVGLAAVVAAVPASLAQGSEILHQGKSAGPGTEEQDRRTEQGPGSGAGVVVAAPIGSVSVGPDVVGGESVYVRRTTAGKGITIVEVSTTPFMPVADATASGTQKLRPDQPASW